MTAATLDAFLNSYSRDGDPLKQAVAATVASLARGGRQDPPHAEPGRARRRLRRRPRHQCRRRRPEGARHRRRRHLPRRRAPGAGGALRVGGAGAARSCSTRRRRWPSPSTRSTAPPTSTPTSRSAPSSRSSPRLARRATDPAAPFLQAGSNQLGAGFFIYGPQLALVLSLGSGTHVFVLSTRLGTFVQAYESRIIPERTQEFAINASNYRHWDEAVRALCRRLPEGRRRAARAATSTCAGSPRWSPIATAS